MKRLMRWLILWALGGTVLHYEEGDIMVFQVDMGSPRIQQTFEMIQDSMFKLKIAPVIIPHDVSIRIIKRVWPSRIVVNPGLVRSDGHPKL